MTPPSDQMLQELDDATIARANAKLGEGLAAQQSGRLADAEAAYREVLKLMPGQFDALHMLGVIAAQVRNFTLAAELIGSAVDADPGNATAHYNLGYVLEELKQYLAAIASYNQAIARKPDHFVAYNNRGVALHALNRLDDAIISFDEAIRINPNYAEARYNRGVALSDKLDHAAAVESFDAARQLNPEYPFLDGMRLYTKLLICDWRGFDRDVADLRLRLERGEPVTPPWPALALTNSCALQRSAARLWVQNKHPGSDALGSFAPRQRPEKIRVGYFSMDFRNHPVALLTAGLFEAHNRDAFETYAFSYGPNTQDDMRKRLSGAFHRFIDVGNKTDQDIAGMARAFKIDIAVDLAGYTTGSRAGIFAFRAAPLQVSYLGFAGTSGAGYMDYLIADETVVPPASLAFYDEKIVALPNCYQANDRSREIAPKIFSRAEAGLPPSGFVFCCFNRAYKITPDVFTRWMRILRRVDSSVLWLSDDHPAATLNLRQEAERAGVDPKRLIFAPQMASSAEHLARHRAADLFLDTMPFNAHTTAGDALWAELPVLTVAGEGLAGRVAASMLKAIDLPELIASTPEDYEAHAVALAAEPRRLHDIKAKLERNRLTTPLFDIQQFTRHVEDAYRRMIERQYTGLPPEHIRVAR